MDKLVNSLKIYEIFWKINQCILFQFKKFYHYTFTWEVAYLSFTTFFSALPKPYFICGWHSSRAILIKQTYYLEMTGSNSRFRCKYHLIICLLASEIIIRSRKYCNWLVSLLALSVFFSFLAVSIFFTQSIFLTNCSHYIDDITV